MTTEQQQTCTLAPSKPSIGELIVLFGVVLYLGYLLKSFGFLTPEVVLGGSVGLGAVFLMGLIAAASSCIAVSGGLMLSSVASFQKRYGGNGKWGKMQPTLLFVLGRVVAYTVLGGAIGYIGQAFVPSPVVLGVITFFAATYMLIMGLNMLSIAPVWVRRLTPTMPRVLTKKILGGENREGWFMPSLLGGATFFLPCGFTQALQIFALTTGSAVTSALILGVFALGTAPSLLALGWASSSLKGQTGAWFYRFSGALVVVLGVWNVGNAATISGIDLEVPSFALSSTSTNEDPSTGSDPYVKMVDGVQVINMRITGQEPFYLPADTYTVKAGTPVRMEITGIGTGCRTIFQIPKYNVSVPLIDPVNIVEFTPTKTGKVVFSCSMGMYKGTLNVI